MLLGCISSRGSVVEEFCTPECSRWTGINDGNPVKIYHDWTGITINQYPSVSLLGDQVAWQPGFYSTLPAQNPIAYLEEAVAKWNAAYSCGTLFEFVDDPQDADVLFIYRATSPAQGEPNAVGNALCLCDTDNQITCSVNADHSTRWFPGMPAWTSINFVTPALGNLDFVSTPAAIQVMMHELGHTLGMGHSYIVPDPNGGPGSVLSIMGNWDVNQAPFTTVQGWDLERLNLRYPCGCTLTNNYISSAFAQEVAHLAHENCPGCLYENNPLCVIT